MPERWKRRVGQLHWALEEDEFVRYSPHAVDVILDESLVIETPLSSSASPHVFLRYRCHWGVVVLAIVGMTFVLKRHKGKIPVPPPIQVLLSWCHNKRKASEVKETKSSPEKKRDGDINIDDQVAGSAVMNDRDCEGGTLAAGSKNCTSNDVTGARTCTELKRMLQPTKLETSNQSCAEEYVGLTKEKIALPMLVAEKSETVPESNTLVLSCSNSLMEPGTITTDISTTSIHQMNALSLKPSPWKVMAASAAHDANNVAQSIRVTQAVFQQHGLDSSLATEWAMRRQESQLSVCNDQLCVC